MLEQKKKQGIATNLSLLFPSSHAAAFHEFFSLTATMALQRFTKSVDGTIPIQALIYDDEEIIISQDGVGIYDG